MMNKIYKEYVMARNSIQLIDAYIIDVKISRFKEQEGEANIQFGLATRSEYVDEKNADAYLKTQICVSDVSTEEIISEIEVACKGQFNSDHAMTEEKLIGFVDMQIVPQLLPYVRSAVASLSAMMSIASINLPTMDIIGSIRKNMEEGDLEGNTENE